MSNPNNNHESKPQDWNNYTSQQRKAWHDQQRAMRDYSREAWRNGYPAGNQGMPPMYGQQQNQQYGQQFSQQYGQQAPIGQNGYYYNGGYYGPQQWMPVYRRGPHVGLIVWGVIFLLVGGGFLSRTFHILFIPEIDGRYFWPVLITVVGLILIISAIAAGVRNSNDKRKTIRYWNMQNAQQSAAQPMQQPYQQPTPEPEPAAAPQSQENLSQENPSAYDSDDASTETFDKTVPIATTDIISDKATEKTADTAVDTKTEVFPTPFN